MRYLSTRGGMPPQRFTDILLGGLAPDDKAEVEAAQALARHEGALHLGSLTTLSDTAAKALSFRGNSSAL